MSSLVALLLGLPPFSWQCGCQPEYGPNEHPGAFLYEEGTIHDFAFSLTPEAADELDRNGPDVHATMTWQGLSWEVGFKLKGSSTYQDLGGKPSIKVDMEEWVDDQAILGVRRLTFNSMVFDGTMLREHVAYRLYQAMGVPAPRHGYARLSINGEPYGLYGIVETMDERFLRRMFPGDSEGNLYDTLFNWTDLDGMSLSNFELQEGDPEAAYADLEALLDDIDRRDILDVLDTRFDRESVLSMWAVELVAPAWDGYARNTNNYLLYHATVSDRWYFIPWGQDTTFAGGGFLYTGVRGRLVSACVNDAACREALQAKVVEVLETWEAIDLVGYATRTWEAIGAACEADPRRDRDCDPDDIFEQLTARPERIREELGL